MNITCNGEQRTVEINTTLSGLVGLLNLNPKTLVAEINGQIIEYTSFDSRELQDGDNIELIRFVGGG